MKKKRILHILNTGTYSGAENVVITMINSMKDSVDAVYMSLEGPIGEVLKENGITHYPVNKLSFKTIRKAVLDVSPDIVHAHDFTAGIISSVAVHGIPIINHLHNNSPWMRQHGVKSLLYRISCIKFRKILTVSNSVMDEYVYGAQLEKKATVVGNPIDLDAIREKADAGIINLRSESISSDIIFLGRLDPQKNVLFFLDIIALVKDRLPSVKVSVVGDGELRSQFVDRVSELGLENNVTVYGFQSNPYPFLRESKMMCMPSRWEGFGLAAVEALAVGKPVVASPVGGLRDIVTVECGLLCNNAKEYADEIYRLITDEVYYQKKSKAASKRAQKYNNYKQYAFIIETAYEDIV